MAETILLGPDDGALQLHTTRTGAAAKMGHDLVIAVRRWKGAVTLSEDGQSVTAVSGSAETASCEVIEGHGGVKPLSDGDRATIKSNIEKDVLLSEQHPEISFQSTAVEGMTIQGQLTLAGVTRPWELHCELVGDRVVGRGSVSQSAHGVKIYSAMMGALKVGDVVGVTVEVRNPRA